MIYMFVSLLICLLQMINVVILIV